ncbi:MAG: cupin domain-containing protein [Acidobacteriales bacterium]|nr:cupin domain-containing protein [Terriglobales bacterium]
MTLYRWNEINKERLNPRLERQVIHGERMTVARIFLEKGVLVPSHEHENEQISMVAQGKLRFHIDGEEEVVEAGSVVVIPPGAPHFVQALEDSVAIDLFSPVREDWRRGDDAYLR